MTQETIASHTVQSETDSDTEEVQDTETAESIESKRTRFDRRDFLKASGVAAGTIAGGGFAFGDTPMSLVEDVEAYSSDYNGLRITNVVAPSVHKGNYTEASNISKSTLSDLESHVKSEAGEIQPKVYTELYNLDNNSKAIYQSFSYAQIKAISRREVEAGTAKSDAKTKSDEGVDNVASNIIKSVLHSHNSIINQLLEWAEKEYQIDGSKSSYLSTVTSSDTASDDFRGIKSKASDSVNTVQYTLHDGSTVEVANPELVYYDSSASATATFRPFKDVDITASKPLDETVDVVVDSNFLTNNTNANNFISTIHGIHDDTPVQALVDAVYNNYSDDDIIPEGFITPLDRAITSAKSLNDGPEAYSIDVANELGTYRSPIGKTVKITDKALSETHKGILYGSVVLNNIERMRVGRTYDPSSYDGTWYVFDIVDQKEIKLVNNWEVKDIYDENGDSLTGTDYTYSAGTYISSDTNQTGTATHTITYEPGSVAGSSVDVKEIKISPSDLSDHDKFTNELNYSSDSADISLANQTVASVSDDGAGVAITLSSVTTFASSDTLELTINNVEQNVAGDFDITIDTYDNSSPQVNNSTFTDAMTIGGTVQPSVTVKWNELASSLTGVKSQLQTLLDYRDQIDALKPSGGGGGGGGSGSTGGGNSWIYILLSLLGLGFLLQSGGGNN